MESKNISKKIYSKYPNRLMIVGVTNGTTHISTNNSAKFIGIFKITKKNSKIIQNIFTDIGTGCQIVVNPVNLKAIRLFNALGLSISL